MTWPDTFNIHRLDEFMPNIHHTELHMQFTLTG